eukprot:TRINITY_DN60950_c0_g1_i1.p1 TRINITY_DN60950_c0_g1~~TRINITY_DN60950_c0_g1_i1.p1  ORF type:complete len:773 (+),score=197.87 TRINITY_DN60950_c0_g1_i1:74-2320(+)
MTVDPHAVDVADIIAAPLLESLDAARALIEGVLERPEALLDPASKEAKDVARGARDFVKVFHDKAHAYSHLSLGKTVTDPVSSIVVHGFDRDQIWEGLEIQNVPLRRQLRRRLAKLDQERKSAIQLEALSQGNTEEVCAAAAIRLANRAINDGGRRRRQRQESAKPESGEPSVEKIAVESTVDADEDSEDVTDDTVNRGERFEKDQGDVGQLEDRFFNLKDMEEFSNLADSGKMRLDEDAGESEFDLLEAAADSDDDEAKHAKFSDFFDPIDSDGKDERPRVKRGDTVNDSKRKRVSCEEADASDDVGDEEELEEEAEEVLGDDVADADGNEEVLSEEERELEKEIQRLQSEGATDEDDESDEDEVGEEEKGCDGSKTGKVTSSKAGSGESLYDVDKRLRALEDEVAKLEEDQLKEKHWSLKGEVAARERPLNSLLEVYLEQPMTHFAGRQAEAGAGASVAGAGGEDELDDVPGSDGIMSKSGSGFDVEAMIRQRIWDETFDDVVRRQELPPSQRPHGAEDDAAETLNFEKSRVGLGEIYAKQYESELLGHKTDSEVKEDKEKSEAKSLFAKVMFKLDQLTNAHFTPRPPMLGLSGEQLAKVPSLKMEETIPLMMSDAALKAPEEQRAPRRHSRGREEFSHEERVAARRLKKEGRRKALNRRVEENEISIKGMRERSAKLEAKNREAKREAAAKSMGAVKGSKTRLRSTELLAQAAESAASSVSRKEAARAERAERPEGASSSKRLKL